MSFRTRGGIYSNSSNRTRTRMDMRDQTDPATMAGVRNTHRDMRGNVIGGKDRYGRSFGTKSNNGESASQPAWRTMPAQAPAPAPVAAAPVTTKRAPAVLPVEPASMRRPAPQGSAPAPTAATAKPALPESKLTPQLVTNTAGMPVQRDSARRRINPLTGKAFGYRPGDGPATPAAPAPAPSGIAAKPAPPKPMMTQPAAGKSPSWKQATAPVPPISGTAAPAPRKGGLESTIADINKARASTQAMIAKPTAGTSSTSFAVKPTANPQSIGATPASTLPAPASQFAQLTTPKPAAQSVAKPAATAPVATTPAPAPIQGGPRMVDPVQRSRNLDAQRAASFKNRQATESAAFEKKKAAMPNLIPSLGDDSGINRAARWGMARYTK